MKPWGVLKSMCHNSTYYSYEMQRVLDPIEHFQILGYDASTLRLGGLTSNDVRDLTGNAHDLRQVTIVLASLLYSLQIPGLWQGEA
jgi:hypothetical protein